MHLESCLLFFTWQGTAPRLPRSIWTPAIPFTCSNIPVNRPMCLFIASLLLWFRCHEVATFVVCHFFSYNSLFRCDAVAHELDAWNRNFLRLFKYRLPIFSSSNATWLASFSNLCTKIGHTFIPNPSHFGIFVCSSLTSFVPVMIHFC